MALAFRLVTLKTPGTVSSAETVKVEERFQLDGLVRKNKYGRPVIDVALKSFKFEAFWGNNPEDWEIGGQEIELEVDQEGHQTGTVRARMNLRPRQGVKPAGFRGEIEALVIADLEENPRP